MMHKAWHSIGKVPFLFSNVIHQISRWHGKKNCSFWPELSISRLQLQFDFTDAFEMMHRAWCSKEELAYFFKVIHQISRSHGLKNWTLWTNLSEITRVVAAIKPLVTWLTTCSMTPLSEMNLCHQGRIPIEGTKTTSMEDVSTGVL